MIEFNRSQHQVSKELQKEFDFLHIKQPLNIKIIKKKFKKNHSLQLKLNSLLNSYESFARGIFFGIYDEDLINSYKYFQEYTDKVDWDPDINLIMKEAQFEWYSNLYEEIKNKFITNLEWLEK